eukprot:TRINITY_DN1381_c0_g5_i1.p2 TRINITY_DN1381_c0_g5~~TRINITY_DN1381_c0_g5_i1.p2  ORF type:complete len:102 (+),score=17.64 TRINITY_DN1381_c0_g5_i1:69-374(+)
MDPTITVGNIFSAKGTQNHILSNQWKDTVRKEQQLHKGWKSKYAKGLIEREGELLNKSAEIDLLETNRYCLPRSLCARLPGPGDQQPRLRVPTFSPDFRGR